MPKHQTFLFSIRVFFHGHRREGIIFDSTLLLPPSQQQSEIYFQLFKWDNYHMFLNACIYQTFIWWDLPPYRITIWLIGVVLVFVCLLVDLILSLVIATVDARYPEHLLSRTFTVSNQLFSPLNCFSLVNSNFCLNF